MFKNRNFLILIFIFTFISVGITDDNYSKNNKADDKIKFDYQLSAKALSNQIDENKLAVEERYGGKILLLTGTIESIGRIDFLGHYIDFSELIMVLCYFDENEKKSLLKLRRGDVVIIKGEFKNSGIVFIMQNCVLVKKY